jgi:rubredoxin
MEGLGNGYPPSPSRESPASPPESSARLTERSMKENWFCPNCGLPAVASVDLNRLVMCEPCRWVFDVRLFGYIESSDGGKVVLRKSTIPNRERTVTDFA